MNESLIKIEEPKIIYIVGGGHSGSTLLDKIIGSSELAISTGELFFLDFYKGGDNHKKMLVGKVCSCGENFNKCPFWSNVTFKKKKNIIKDWSLKDSIKIAVNILNPLENNYNFNDPQENNYEVFSNILRQARKESSKVRYIIDSSKDPRRLYGLVKDPLINLNNLYVVHIIKDGRGYISSYRSVKRKEGGLEVKSSFYYLLEWLVINIFTKIILLKYKLKNITVSYDNFAKEPSADIIRINKFLSTNVNSENILEAVQNTIYHQVHGNLLRFSKIEKIKYDRSWERNLNLGERVIYSLLLYPFHKLWMPRKHDV